MNGLLSSSLGRNLRQAVFACEIDEMYPVFIEVATFQQEKGAQRTFEWAYGTEIMHKKLFEKAKNSADAGKDLDLGPVQVCSVCGYTLEGGAPDKCPLCGAAREKFVAFE